MTTDRQEGKERDGARPATGRDETPASERPPKGAADGLRDVTNVDRAIHEPARLLIVAILSAVAEADFLFLLRETGLTKGNLSAHLAKLEDAGYVAIEKTYRGKIPHTLCRLTDAGGSAFADYRERMKRFVDKIPTK
jgi:DNA-binding transcriptional ArsR family regulator